MNNVMVKWLDEMKVKTQKSGVLAKKALKAHFC